MDRKRTFKIIVIGNTNTGKTSIIHQYTRHSFPEAHFTTPLPIEHTQSVNGCILDIWDTAGAEEWQSMNSSVYHGSNAVIFLCSYDEQKSLDDLKDTWRPKILQYLSDGNNVKFFLAVNKSDIPEDDKKIEENQIQQMKNDINAIESFSVSAKDNINVNELFQAVAEALLQDCTDQDLNRPVPNTEQQQKPDKCC